MFGAHSCDSTDFDSGSHFRKQKIDTMERVSADDHPLSTVGRSSLRSNATGPGRAASQAGTSNSEHRTHAHYQSRTPSASLIQSAVRSVLDDATPSTIVSDDRSEGGSFVDVDPVASGYSYTSSPALDSLKIERLPPIPDTQDRKRFIGCLAAVLASAYDYDEPDCQTMSDVESSSKGSFAYLDFVEDDEADQNNDGDRSFGYARSSISYSFEDSSDIGSAFDETSEGRRQEKAKQRSSNMSTGSLRPPTWGKSAKEKEERARQRNRRRRYELCCELLMTSAELLLLEKSVARGFLPMLSQILFPRPKIKPSKVNTRGNLPPQSMNRVGSYSAPSSPAEKVQLAKQASSSFTIDGYETVELRTETGPPKDTERTLDYEAEELDREDVLRPFLESLTPGSGFRCLSMLLLQHLLTSSVGYDARIRHVLKKLGVLVLVHDMGNDPVEQELLHGNDEGNSSSFKELLTHAARKFESLEHSIARRLIRLSKTKPGKKTNNGVGMGDNGRNKDVGFTKEKLMRGVKIGSAGIVAGTLFALTGGLAAPGIAAGVAAVAGSTAAATAAVVTLTSTAVVTTIFGVGGGSLAAYKMQRRTQGLTEFEFRKELTDLTRSRGSKEQRNASSEPEAQLFTTICISGWLRDKYDYQRPWGLHPNKPRLVDRLELLERFYSVFRPDYLPNCTRILSSWKGEESGLWGILREKYGRDPDHLFPLSDGPRLRGNLTLDQEEVLDLMFVELGYNSVAPSRDPIHKNQQTPFERLREGWHEHQHDKSTMNHNPSGTYDSLHGPSRNSFHVQRGSSREGGDIAMDHDRNEENDASEEGDYQPPKHLSTVWDYATTYGGELYTVRWESTLLKTICDCVMDLAMDVVSGATRQILKATILSTLLAAVVLPSYLLNVANMIDGDWTLAVERADEAGKELARTLLFSRAGQRPVTLVGFSFGARVIYACLKELARLQDEWEDLQEMKRKEEKRSSVDEHHFSKLSKKFNGMREPSSVVEDAVIMGLPNHLSLPSWKACRLVVAGRLVNCYSTKDLILSLMFQAKRFSPGVQSILKPVCGTCEVNEAGVENIDVSDLVQGHQDYCLLTGRILERVKFGEPLRQRKCSEDISVDGESGPAKQLQF